MEVQEQNQPNPFMRKINFEAKEGQPVFHKGKSGRLETDLVEVEGVGVCKAILWEMSADERPGYNLWVYAVNESIPNLATKEAPLAERGFRKLDIIVGIKPQPQHGYRSFGGEGILRIKNTNQDFKARFTPTTGNEVAVFGDLYYMPESKYKGWQIMEMLRIEPKANPSNNVILGNLAIHPNDTESLSSIELDLDCSEILKGGEVN